MDSGSETPHRLRFDRALDLLPVDGVKSCNACANRYALYKAFFLFVLWSVELLARVRHLILLKQSYRMFAHWSVRCAVLQYSL